MKQLLRLVLSIVILAGVIWLVRPQEAFAALRAPHPGWLALAIAALGVQIPLSALRWQVTARALGQDLPRLWAMQEYGLSVAANTFLPGGVLGDLGRILRSRGLHWQGRGWQGAMASVLIERLAGQVAMAALILGALWLWLGALGAALGLGIVAVLLLAGWVWSKPRNLLVRAWCAPGLWPWQLGLTLAILAVNLLGFWAAAQAVGVALSAGDALALIPLTLFSMVIPLTINGWGLREGVAAALWPLAGINAAQAVAASVIYGLVCMAAALVGLLPWLVRARAPGAEDRASTDRDAQPEGCRGVDTSL